MSTCIKTPVWLTNQIEWLTLLGGYEKQKQIPIPKLLKNNRGTYYLILSINIYD